MTANEKRSFVLKHLTSNRIRTSRIATIHTRNWQNTVKFRLFMEFLGLTLTRKVSTRLVKLSLFMFVLFLKLVSFYFQQTTGLFRVCILRSSKSCQP